MHSIADEARTIHRQLQGIGFRPPSKGNPRNPIWYTCVVIAMIRTPGTRTAINEMASEVAEVLGWGQCVEKRGRKASESCNPCFHLGEDVLMHGKTPSEYFQGLKGEPMVGKYHTFDDIEPYCSTHECSWRDSDSCTPACEYRLRIRTRNASGGYER